MEQYRDLAPEIYRQRLVVEGCPRDRITAADITSYLELLGDVCEMRVLTKPVTHRSDLYGWAGWVHWENSGAHFYAWEPPSRLFFSVDVYTCKPFSAGAVEDFTRKFFDTTAITRREF